MNQPSVLEPVHNLPMAKISYQVQLLFLLNFFNLIGDLLGILHDGVLSVFSRHFEDDAEESTMGFTRKCVMLAF